MLLKSAAERERRQLAESDELKRKLRLVSCDLAEIILGGKFNSSLSSRSSR